MEELCTLFELAGLKISQNGIKELFAKCKGLQIGSELNLEDFQKVMLSDETNKHFKKMIYEKRLKFKYNDYKTVSADTKFLPIDLGLMLTFIYQKVVNKKLKDNAHDAQLWNIARPNEELVSAV